MEPFVFDTGPLAHFARAGWLGVLKSLVGRRSALIPMQVAAELQAAAAREPSIAAVLDTGWIKRHELGTDAELRSFASFAERLVSGERNLGEAAVLAVAATMPAQAVIDDSAAHKAAQRAGVSSIRTLALLCDAIRRGMLTTSLVSNIADDLIATEYRLPFEPGRFIPWAIAEGLLPDRPTARRRVEE